MIRFDEFVLDLAGRQLTRDGAVLHLTPKAFDLLALLVAEAPRVVPKAELHERLWTGTFVVDATLVGVVKELRRVLDDRSLERPIIRTAHRIGYAFCRPTVSGAVSRPAVTHSIFLDRRRVDLKEGENTIGRDPASVVWIDSAAVSRRHARIRIDSQGARVQDLGSKNGTRVGGHPVLGETSLQDGDVIEIGPARLLYRTSAGEVTTETRGSA